MLDESDPTGIERTLQCDRLDQTRNSRTCVVKTFARQLTQVIDAAELARSGEHERTNHTVQIA
jgi:hypothetical protein